MPEDIQLPKGPTRRSKPGGTGANPLLVPILGIVKDNVDPTRAGRIFVYLANNSGLDPNDRTSWRPVKLLSPFFGFTAGDAATDNYGNFKNNPSSYGMWMSPPDIGTTVLCLFVNGDINYGFYVGCVPDPETLQMVPAIGATDNIVPNQGEAESFGGALRLPVTNINKNNKAIADTPDYLTAAKPVHSYSAAIMFQQGILRDPIRGPISSSSQRETPSRVGWGVSTPGRPIYEGGFDDTTIADNLKKDKDKQLRVVARRGGHSIVMDDGDIIGRDQLIRIRSAKGHQILMSDDGQTLMILHSNGQSYVELGKEGTVDVYSTNSINLRTQGDLNLHADNNINIHATKNLNIQAENIHVASDKEYKQRVGSDYSNFTNGKHTTRVNGAMSMQSKGDISMASSALAFVNGSKVNLNSGQTSTKPQPVPEIQKILHTDTLFDETKGFLAAPAKLKSITSRAPAHMPWANAGQGVDVKTDLTSSAQLPAQPASAVSDVNAVASSAGIKNPVNNATTSAVPNTPAASLALDQNVTKSLVGQIATNAANGPLANAITQGTAIAQTAQGTTVGIGQFAQTPQQLEQSGILKPGAAALVNSVAAATGNVQQAMTNNLFTGKPGAENLNNLVKNIQPQTESVVQNLQKAQTSLQSLGAITGRESGTQIGGLIYGAAKNGIDPTVGAMQSSSLSAGLGQFTSNLFDFGLNQSQTFGSFEGLSGDVNQIMQDIAAGNFAATLGQDAAGALNGLQGSLDSIIDSDILDSGGINQAAGITAEAFSAIASSIKPLKAGVPQNLTAIAKESAKNVSATAVADSTSSLNQAANAITEIAKNGLAGSTNSAGGVLTGAAAESLGTTASAVNKILPNTSSIADSLVGASKLASGSNDFLNNVVTQTSNQTNIISPTTLPTLTNPSDLLRNPNSAADSLINSAKNLSSGAESSFAGGIASGLNNLPGGLSATTSITNLGKGKLPNLPGTTDLKATIQNKATDLLNNIGTNILGNASSLLSQISGSAGGISSVVPNQLPVGQASELKNAVGSVAAAGSGIKMPSVAVNTTNRAPIQAAVVNQIGDPGIPAPTFGEVSEQAKTKVEAQQLSFIEANNELQSINSELNKLSRDMVKKKTAFANAQNKLPQGDPKIAELENEYRTASRAFISLNQSTRERRAELLARLEQG